MENKINFQEENKKQLNNNGLNQFYLSDGISQKQDKHCNYKEDFSKILERINFLNNTVPRYLPEYNFNIDEINGEYYYKQDGTPLLIREYDGNLIRDYYCQKENTSGKLFVSRILEHDKDTGQLKTKIEKNQRKYRNETTSITIFDTKINNKYIIIQISEGGIVNNFSEFSGIGKSFQTLFRNINTCKPVRYISGTDSKENGFEMLDCILDAEGNIAKINSYTR